MEVFMEEFQHLKIPLEDILFATDNFSEDNVTGVGGFGKVYKGEISHSKGRNMVAFKRLDPRYGQGNPEFWKEIMMLSRYTHENLVSLLGFCDEGGEKILLYEYASHGSLDRHLSSTDLKWIQRLKICIGITKGLRYLHDPNGTQQRVLHRDIKSANLLVDNNWNIKVSDFGLSKMGPANQQHTLLVSHAVGTPGYCDPLYMEMGFLTKESDVYSLGVVLFEVMCGRLCFEYSNGQCHILVPMWKQSYKNNRLDGIVFQGLMQQMDPSSLEIFSDTAYRCLEKSREERPMISNVVEKLEIALKFQEIYEVVKQPNGYDEIIKAAIPPLIYKSMEELKMRLSKGILLNEGKTWFSVNKNGEHCEMISSAECLIPIASESRNRYLSDNGSRFVGGFYLAYDGKFKTHVKTQFLTPQITYTINLVFKFIYKKKSVIKPTYSVIKYKLDGDAKQSISYFADQREDGLLMAELYQFTSDSRYTDLKIMFEASYSLAVEGIEFRPCEKVRREILEDEKIDTQSISDTDADWEKKLPNNYKEMIKLSKVGVQWTTCKKELYFIFREGFLINNGKEWLSLAKNGKKCHMLPARMVFLEEQWSWESLPESRFEEVAVHPDKTFSIVCTINSQILSSRTRYATYLVYKLPQSHYEFEAPMILTDKDFQLNDEEDFRFIYLLSPQTPVIGPKVNQNTHNPLNLPKMKGLPKRRRDGWMEVQIFEFLTGFTTKMISMHLELTSCFYKVIEGLIVQGIEFKPIYI